jgi:hypothetical protein
MKNLITKNSIEEIKQKEINAHLLHESKIQWEIPKFEEIELESGIYPSAAELRAYRS